MGRAKSVTEILATKMESFPFTGEWHDAFGCPDRRGVWIVWGNSGSGKSTFVMQLCKYLCQFGRVAYDSLEEGVCLTMRNTLVKCGMMEVNRRFLLLDNEPMDKLSIRLKKQKSPDIVVIDSFQYTQMNYKQYIAFKEQHRDKLLIFISHADGKQPRGSSANSVMYDASLKIHVDNFRAFSRGRTRGATEKYDIWPEKARILWGEAFLEE